MQFRSASAPKIFSHPRRVPCRRQSHFTRETVLIVPTPTQPVHNMKIPVPTPKDKMNIIKFMVEVHKVKRFSKAKSEPAFQVFRKHPITRGMASYLVIWPFGNVIQQTLSDQDKYDWWKVIRFGLYGCLITAPSLYAWVRLSTAMWPNTTFRIACAKALTEQISYTPFAMSIFFYSMTWLETFSAAEAWLEVKTKFLPTYLVAVSFWPIIGTINFAFIPERNRVFFVSCFSLLWTVYLAHIKNMEVDKIVLAKKTKELADAQSSIGK